MTGAQRKRLVVALLAWSGCAALFFLVAYAWAGGVPQLMETVLIDVASSSTGMLLLLGIYLVRPFLLIPTTILTAFCGYLYGPWLGLAIAHSAALGSALVGYTAARVWLGLPEAVPVAWRKRLRERSFETILISRLAFMPGDLVNAAAGGLALPITAFVGATLLGGLPGSLVGVTAGAAMSAGPFQFGAVQIRPGFIGASLALALASVLVAALLRRRGVAEMP